MIIISHIIIALTSIIFTSYVFISPSKKGLNISYFLALATLASGSYLIFKTPSHMVQSCIMGVAYLGFVIFAIVSARRKLSSSKLK